MIKRILTFTAFLGAFVVAFQAYYYMAGKKDVSSGLPELSLSAPSAFIGNQATFVASLDGPAKDTVSFSLRWDGCTALSGGEASTAPAGVASFFIPAGESMSDLVIPWDFSGMVPGEYSVTFFVCDVRKARVSENTSVTLTFSVDENLDGNCDLVCSGEKNGRIALARRDDGFALRSHLRVETPQSSRLIS